MKSFVFSLSALFLLPLVSFAHSGGTDFRGCHNDTDNVTYHCHNLQDEEVTIGETYKPSITPNSPAKSQFQNHNYVIPNYESPSFVPPAPFSAGTFTPMVIPVRNEAYSNPETKVDTKPIPNKDEVMTKLNENERETKKQISRILLQAQMRKITRTQAIDALYALISS